MNKSILKDGKLIPLPQMGKPDAFDYYYNHSYDRLANEKDLSAYNKELKECEARAVTASPELLKQFKEGDVLEEGVHYKTRREYSLRGGMWFPVDDYYTDEEVKNADCELRYVAVPIPQPQPDTAQVLNLPDGMTESEYHARCAWDTTTQERDELRNQVKALEAIKTGLERSLKEALQKLNQHPDTAQGEREAIAFAEWIKEQGYEPWTHTDDFSGWFHRLLGPRQTTEQLYERFTRKTPTNE